MGSWFLYILVCYPLYCAHVGLGPFLTVSKCEAKAQEYAESLPIGIGIKGYRCGR